jgi:16S rRNA (uracil1498-N3)-methyltransferase
MHLFYSAKIAGPIHQLNEEESRHIAKVLRLKPGDTIFLTDGNGNLYETLISESNGKSCIVNIVNSLTEYNKRSFRLHIAIAPTKSTDRFKWFLEKATEIGIDEITPLICEHSERAHVKTERFNKVIIAAMKQSLKAYLPKLNEPEKFSDFTRQSYAGQKMIAWCGDDAIRELKEIYTKGSPALILIGPEGDFSPIEVRAAINNGFVPVSLGKSRLRTETAGIVACHTCNLVSSVTRDA